MSANQIPEEPHGNQSKPGKYYTRTLVGESNCFALIFWLVERKWSTTKHTPGVQVTFLL